MKCCIYWAVTRVKKSADAHTDLCRLRSALERREFISSFCFEAGEGGKQDSRADRCVRKSCLLYMDIFFTFVNIYSEIKH